MSLRAITEFILHLEHFRNVDLIQQGLYFLKFQIFNEKDDKIFYANPYHHDSKDTDVGNQPSSESAKVSNHRLIEPYIVDETNSFYTKTFFIKYAEELVVMRDIVKFRTEIDIQPGYLETEFFLKAEIFYQPPPANNFSRCMNSPKDMQQELLKSGEQFKMVQARLYQINRGLTGVSSFLPISFDREYTCLTMCTVHSTLIDYRFRTLPQPKINISHNQKKKKNRKQKKGQNSVDLSFDEIEINPSVFDEEDQTFIQNGIVIESKYDLTDADKQKMWNQKIQKSLEQKWLPQNTTEYLFFDDYGLLTISEEQVKALNGEFTSLMKSIYQNLAKKYEDIVKNIVTDSDIDQIDFPLIAQKFQVEKLSELLTPELIEKLGGLQDEDEENQEQQPEGIIKKKNEEFKEGELDDMNKAKAATGESSMNEPQDMDDKTFASTQVAVNDQQSSQDISDTMANMNLNDAGEQAGHGQFGGGSSGDAGNNSSGQSQSDGSSFVGLSEGQINDQYVGGAPNNTSKLRGMSLVNQNSPQFLAPIKNKVAVEYSLEEANKVANAIIMSINVMAGQLFQLHNNMYQLLYFKPRRVYKNLAREYQNAIEKSYGENILRHVVLTQDFSFPSEDFTGQLNDVVAKKTREVIKMHIELDGEDQQPVEELNIIVDEYGKKNRRVKNMERYAPLIFEECFIRNQGMNRVANTFEIDSNPGLKKKIDPSVAITNYRGMHLFVLSHGFQGSSFDMRIIKNIISIALPDALFLCAQANEQDTDVDIFEMGQKLADEVHQYINESCPGSQLGRLSFIGHSMGGLIIRSALPHLDKYKDKFHGLQTLCSPHLGYMYKSSKLVNTGMSVMKMWKKSVAFNQLQMTDSKDIEQTALYRLSQARGLENFKHIILISSYQDQYAPFDSARIQICGDAARDQKKGSAYIQMVNNLLGKCTTLDVLYRLDVNFNIEETNIDSVLGRTAHILFLENEDLMKMIVARYKMFYS